MDEGICSLFHHKNINKDDYIKCIHICDAHLDIFSYDYKQIYTVNIDPNNNYNIICKNKVLNKTFYLTSYYSSGINFKLLIESIQRSNKLNTDSIILVFIPDIDISVDTNPNTNKKNNNVMFLFIYLNKHILKIQSGQNYYDFLNYVNFNYPTGINQISKSNFINNQYCYSKDPKTSFNKKYELKISDQLYDINNIKPKITKYFNINYDLYNHQLMNILWMINLEKQINIDPSFYYHDHYLLHKLDNDFLINKSSRKIFSMEQLYTHNGLSSCNIYGGIICDNVGKGKTLSIIGFLVHEYLVNTNSKVDCESTLNTDSNKETKMKLNLRFINNKENKEKTLIICPSRIFKQWIEEFNKFINSKYDLKIKSISTCNNAMSFDINSCNVLITTPSLLENMNYIQHLKDEKDIFNIFSYPWKRVIIDEIHEITSHYILNISSQYRWGISATPFMSYVPFYDMINFLRKDNCFDKQSVKIIYHENNVVDIINTYFRYNDSSSMVVPNYNHYDIIIEPTDLEKIIFNNTNNTDDIYSCIYISKFKYKQNSSDDIINNIVSTNDIKKILIDEYKDLIEKLKVHIVKYVKITESGEHNHTLKINNLKKDIEKYTKYINNLSCNDIINYNENCKLCDNQSYTIIIQPNGYYFCNNCVECLLGDNKSYNCPISNDLININDLKKHNIDHINNKDHINNANSIDKIDKVDKVDNYIISMWGSKMNKIYELVNNILLQDSKKILIFSQSDIILKIINIMFKYYHIEVSLCHGNIYSINKSLHEFNSSLTCNIILLSSETNNSGMNLINVTDIILVDTIVNCNYLNIEKQAIGRAVRFGQKNIVNVYRLIMKDCKEFEQYTNSLKSTKEICAITK